MQPVDKNGSSDSSQSTTSSTQSPQEKSFQIAAPSISLPKGGGAIRGIGEKFAANLVTGTGSMTVPIATSPGRSGFRPQLALSYDSGAGNGPFGFGWSLSLPAITRKTDKGLPKYQDTENSDVFILSGSEDLVPTLIKNAAGKWEIEIIPDRTVNGQVYRIRRYRPRIEGLFARIERWSNIKKPDEVFWRSISKDNVTTWYGKTDESRISDPNDKSRIFSWLICQSYDDKGNVIVYHYKPENPDNVDLAKAHEKNRTDNTNRTANRYLKRVCYGNREPYLPKLTETEWPQPPDLISAGGPPNYYFEVVFDYEDGHYTEAAPDAEGRVFAQSVCYPPASAKWSPRVDPFSSYRSGFEVRTYRLCQRVLMFHHFPDELGTPDCLVRSTDFTYSYENDPNDVRNPIYSFLDSVSQSGYLRQSMTYLKKSLPPVEFTYSKPEIQDLVEEVDPESVENLPIGLDGTAYQWTDLHGEGIPGILTEQAGAWYYKRNWSPIPEQLPDGSEVVKAKFSALETVALKPNVALSSGAQFMDLAGDGQPDLAVLDGPMPGLFEHDLEEGWEPFRPFTSRLNREMRDPNLKFVDLDGDGHADVLITEDDAFVWHPSLAEEGFDTARRVPQAFDEEKGPRLVFADSTQSLYLADLSGDGLTDLVRIRNGEVCYWPNLGYGRFGAKVTMDNAPWFDQPDLFDQKRVRLADIDGSGTTDIIYIHRDGVRLYFNRSGNSWSQPRILNVFPHIDDLTAIMPTDLLGNGTACLVWSSPLSGDARRPMRYVNLIGKDKPHLLIKTVNNLGAETRVHYAPSTKFYLQDKRNGTPWITKLPFPVHVVERVETYDHIGRNRFITRYSYHHGYFDGNEREFRGFGRVDQLDTEEFAALTQTGDLPVGENVAVISHVPPVLTKTWFHTGAYLEHQRFEAFMAQEYYQGDTQASLLADTNLPDQLSADEAREACRALKGSMLRQEVYARDRTNKADHPYTVAELNMTVARLQPTGSNRHAVFFTHAREALTYHYERNPADPRLQHALTLEVDDYGNVLKSAAIGYGRRLGLSSLTGDDKDTQERTLFTYTENDVTSAIDDIALLDDYRLPLPCESRAYELTGLTLPTSAVRFTVEDIRNKAAGAIPLDYEKAPTAGTQEKRLIEHVRTLYRRDDLTGLLPLGDLEPLALPGESYKLAFTQGLLTQVYGSRVTTGMLLDEGKYVHSEGDANWWILSGRVFYSSGSSDSPIVELAEAQTHFFLPRRYRDPFHTNVVSTESVVTYDAYDLLVHETSDGLGNQVTTGERQHTLPDGTVLPEKRRNNYRVLQPELVMDPNRNCTEVRFDALGMVVGTAVMGKPEENPRPGDRFTDAFHLDLTQAEIEQFFADPKGSSAATRLAEATSRIIYDLERYRRGGKPPFAITLARETHVSDLLQDQQTKIQVSFSYSDGFGREIQKKLQAESDKGTFSEDVMVDSPVAYYRLNELEGSARAADASGNDNHGDISPIGMTLKEPGLGANDFAIRFDGRGGGRITVPDREQLNPKYITLEALISWAGPTGDTQQRIIEKPYSDQQETWPTYGLSIQEDGCLKVELLIAEQNDPVKLVSSTKIKPNNAAHVAATYDGNTINLYINGYRDSSKAVGRTIQPRFGFSKVGIGNQVIRDRQFNGVIDEIALYDKALPDERLQSHYWKLWDGNVPRRRWISSGWTIYNNKGKPVRQYEPFFSAIPDFEFGVMAGVSPVLFYDSAERVVATLHPNHTFEKVRFDPWQQTTYDVNDTVTIAPKTDPDVGSFFTLLPDGDYLPTWYDQRIGSPHPEERDAAKKAAAHANTPTVAYFDTLGRTFLTIADNGKDARGAEQRYRTHSVLDIEGNQREVIDALDRIVMRYAYDMLGNRIHQLSMDAGTRWMLNDVSGKPIRTWDSRGHSYRMEYDQLRRPVRTFVAGADPTSPTKEILLQRTVYGEGQAGDLTNNLRTRAVWQFDSAGMIKSQGYDFKGNPLQGVRRIANEYKRQQDWAAIEPLLAVSSVNEPALNAALAGLVEADEFISSTTFDALNRPVTATTPDLSVYRPTFNEANLLEKVTVNLRGAATETLLVKNIDYDAKGQRTNIEYGNGTKTAYEYDPNTFRLINLKTTRLSDNARLQDLSYVYDPAGNITHIGDEAQQLIYFNGGVASPQNDYTYDAIYRLVEATGREHIGQVAQPETTWNDEWRVKLPHPQDSSKMRSYTEAYEYDEVGNFEKLIHQALDGNWTRTYSYSETSLLQPSKVSNRLSGTTVGRTTGTLPAEVYTYDAHGNMLQMPHLPTMQWDCHDQLAQVDLGGGGTAYYVYDATGQRIRKVIERQTGEIEERVYLGRYEIYRKRTGADIRLERETLHVMDDKQRIALTETRTKGSDGSPAQLLRYQYGNHLGSASLELDDQAQIISYEEYFPYGSTSYQAVRNQTETPKRYRYTGKERDQESGLYYHGARYYAPWLGRWCSTDPIGISDGTNLYAYVACSPVCMSDRTGMAKEPELVNIESARGSHTARFQAEHPEVDWNPERGSLRNQPHHFTPIKDVKQALGSDQIARELADQVGASERLAGLPSSRGPGDKVYAEIFVTAEAGAEKEVGKLRLEKNVTIHNAGGLRSQESIERALKANPGATGVEKVKHLLNAGEEAQRFFPDTFKAEGRFLKAEQGLLKKAVSEAKELVSNPRVQKTLVKGANVLSHAKKIVPVIGIVLAAVGWAGTAHAATEGLQAATKGDTRGAVTNLGSAALDVAETVPVAGNVLAAGRTGYAIGELASDLFVNEDKTMHHGEVARDLARSVGLSSGAADVIGGVAAAGSAILQVATWTPLRLL